MEYETDFLKMPLIYQMNVIKKGGRKSKTITVVETVEIPVPCLPDDAQPIAVMSHAKVSLPLTDEQRSEIRKGDYQFYEVEIDGKKELVSTYIDMIPSYSEDEKEKRIIPMKSSLFRGNTHTLNGDDARLLAEMIENTTQKDAKKIAMSRAMTNLGLINPDASAATDDIIIGDPGDMKILSSNKEKRMTQLIYQMKGWCIHKDRLYLPTTGPVVMLEGNYRNNTIKDGIHIRIHQPEIKNPLLQEFDKQFGIQGYSFRPNDQSIKVPFSYIEDIPNVSSQKYIREHIAISGVASDMRPYETYSLFDNVVTYIEQYMESLKLTIDSTTSLKAIGAAYNLKDAFEKFKESTDKAEMLPYLAECLKKYTDSPGIATGRYQSPETMNEHANNFFETIEYLNDVMFKDEHISSLKI